MVHTAPRNINRTKNHCSKGVKMSSPAPNHSKCKDCGVCMRAKGKRLPAPSAKDKDENKLGWQTLTKDCTKFLDMFHSDLHSSNAYTHRMEKYLQGIHDHATKWGFVRLLKKKSHGDKKFRELELRLRQQVWKENRPPNLLCIKCLRTDGEGCYTSNAFKQYAKEGGMELQIAPPHTPTANSRAERFGGDLWDKIRCVLIGSRQPKGHWGRAAETCNYVKNRVYHSSIGTSPFKKRFKRDPDLSHLRVWGCICWAVHPKRFLKQHDDRTQKCVFYGLF